MRTRKTHDHSLKTCAVPSSIFRSTVYGIHESADIAIIISSTRIACSRSCSCVTRRPHETKCQTTNTQASVQNTRRPDREQIDPSVQHNSIPGTVRSLLSVASLKTDFGPFSGRGQEKEKILLTRLRRPSSLVRNAVATNETKVTKDLGRTGRSLI